MLTGTNRTKPGYAASLARPVHLEDLLLLLGGRRLYQGLLLTLGVAEERGDVWSSVRQ